MIFLRKWHALEVADVRQRRANGERVQVIADGYRVTRNSLMGMMFRNGIGPPGAKPKPAPKRKKVTQPKVMQKPMVRPMQQTPPILEPIRGNAWKPLKGRRTIPITQLTRYRCHWPIGDPIRFCGAPSHGCVYCPTHMKIGTAPKKGPVGRPPHPARPRTMWGNETERFEPALS